MASAPTLYERLGGAERIAAIVEEALDRHAVNPALAPRLRGKDLPRLKERLALFFCAGAGGPQRYDGDLRAAHAGLNVNEQELVAAMDDIVAAMKSRGAGPAEVNEVVAILYSLKEDVVRL